MCGIFGIVSSDPRALPRELELLFTLSESRGKEAAGLALRQGSEIRILKEPESASQMIRRPSYRSLLDEAAAPGKGPALAAIGHSRLVTNGLEAIAANNQPVIRDGLVAIHNGIVVNDRRLWRENPDLSREADVDTEVMLALMAKHLRRGHDLPQATAKTFQLIEGTASVGILSADDPRLLLATNNGSLYAYSSEDREKFYFASERYILQQMLARLGRPSEEAAGIRHLPPGTGALVDIATRCVNTFEFSEAILDRSSRAPIAAPAALRIVNLADAVDPRRAQLRRCSRCVMPETMPFISFDDEGVCNFCRSYEPYRPIGVDALRELVAPFRRNDGGPDCMIAVSGGRDSCYGLHVLKAELGLNPIAYTYDWGVITDLARRNQARLCGKLGVEHILVSADIRRKRHYIRKNIEAWLRRPELGMIPLFMAGDKQYFYYADQIRRQLGVEVTFLCENRLERAHFKSGFMGVNEGHNRVFDIGLKRKLQVLGYHAKQYLLNPRYINASVFDTLSAFHSAYLRDHTQVQLFEYVNWDEEELVRVLRSEYDWELAPDTTSTWRIGDGTAAFYNYIYFTVAGFTENDALRSNQVREGILTRERALELVAAENEPRWDSLHWYANTIGFSLSEALQVIHSMPRLYGRDGLSPVSDTGSAVSQPDRARELELAPIGSYPRQGWR